MVLPKESTGKEKKRKSKSLTLNFMEKTICVFGSSIAWGAWDPEKGGWVGRLRSYVETRNNNDYIQVYNCGVSGDNSEWLLKRIEVECVAREPDLVLIAIGMNDSQYINTKDNSRVPLEKFQSNLGELLMKAKKYALEVIFIGLSDIDETKLMPIPWDVTKYYDKENVALYNSKIKEFCEKNNLKFIEMQGLLNNEDLEDGLHPNAQGHEKMFLRVKDFLEL